MIIKSNTRFNALFVFLFVLCAGANLYAQGESSIPLDKEFKIASLSQGVRGFRVAINISDEIKKNVDYWMVEHRLVSDEASLNETSFVSAARLPANLRNIRPRVIKQAFDGEQEWEFQIVGVKDGERIGKSRIHKLTTNETLPPLPPRNVHVRKVEYFPQNLTDDITERRIHIAWDAPEGPPVEGYYLYTAWWDGGTNPRRQADVGLIKDTEHVHVAKGRRSDQTPVHIYVTSVSADNKESLKTDCYTATFCSGTDMERVSVPRVKVLDPDTLQVSWEYETDRNPKGFRIVTSEQFSKHEEVEVLASEVEIFPDDRVAVIPFPEEEKTNLYVVPVDTTGLIPGLNHAVTLNREHLLGRYKHSMR